MAAVIAQTELCWPAEQPVEVEPMSHHGRDADYRIIISHSSEVASLELSGFCMLTQTNIEGELTLDGASIAAVRSSHAK